MFVILENHFLIVFLDVLKNILGVRNYFEHLQSIELCENLRERSGRVFDSRPRGRGFEPHRRHCVMVLRKARPCFTERLLMGLKESSQTNYPLFRCMLLNFRNGILIYQKRKLHFLAVKIETILLTLSNYRHFLFLSLKLVL